jgi:glycosyltransferase involved in cell wall biosynthesis
MNNKNKSLSVCLVTNELYPVTHGGCGTLIFNSIYSLLASGHRVVVLADIKQKQIDQFLKKNLEIFKNSDKLKIVTVDELIVDGGGIVTHSHQGMQQSLRFHLALEKLLETEVMDIVEYPDYLGYAYYTLASREYEASKGSYPKIVVRFHLTMEMIHNRSPMFTGGSYQVLTYGLERWCFSHADYILVASEAVAREFEEFYGEDFPLLISPPVLSAMGIEKRVPVVKQNHVLFYARLAPQKGAEIFIAAALNLLRQERVGSGIMFTVAGPDMYESPEGGSMVAYLKGLIPDKYISRFDFTGNLEISRLNEILPSVLFAVFPTRAETFCYSARELFKAGLPLIVSDIPAFDDLKQKQSVLCAKLSVEDFADKIEILLEDTALRDSLSDRSQDVEDDPKFLAAYNQALELHSTTRQVKAKNIEKIEVIILAPESSTAENLAATKQSLPSDDRINISILTESLEAGSHILWGKHWHSNGTRLADHGAICFLVSGDIVAPGYFEKALDLFRSNPGLGVVGSALMDHKTGEVGDFAWDAAPTLMPFRYPYRLWRCVMRYDEPDSLSFNDLLLIQANEIEMIWSLVEQGYQCVRSPDAQIDCKLLDLGSKEVTMDTAYHLLINRHEVGNPQLRLATTLKGIIRDNLLGDVGLLPAIRRGATPEIGGIRFNLSGILSLLVSRILSRVKKH